MICEYIFPPGMTLYGRAAFVYVRWPGHPWRWGRDYSLCVLTP